MKDLARWRTEQGAIPFVLIGLGAALAGTLGVIWKGSDWAAAVLHEAGGEVTVWVLRGAFWALDLVALQASTAPVHSDWYTPVLEGPAVPIGFLAALVMVATLLAEVVAGMAQGNAVRIVQAVFRALIAGMLATVGAGLLLAVGGALSEVGRAALAASGTSVDAPLVPLQEVLMDTAQGRDGSPELFIAFLAAMVIVFTALSIYFLLAMRPVLLAALIVFLPVAHALSVWTPMRRVAVRAWSLAFAVLMADAAILTMFAVANTAMGQPEGVDRLIFGTFGLLLAALAPAALARIVGAPELHTAVQSMSRGSKLLAVGAGAMAVRGGAKATRAGIADGRRALADWRRKRPDPPPPPPGGGGGGTSGGGGGAMGRSASSPSSGGRSGRQAAGSRTAGGATVGSAAGSGPGASAEASSGGGWQSALTKTGES